MGLFSRLFGKYEGRAALQDPPTSASPTAECPNSPRPRNDPGGADQETKQEVILHPSLIERDQYIGAVWILYATTLSILPKNTFESEVTARSAMMVTWSSDGKKEGLQDKYLDELLMIEKSGYMNEYVWIYLRDPNWKEPLGLRLSEFVNWRHHNLPNHEVQTLAVLREKTTPVPA
jgi:hypothetical protein